MTISVEELQQMRRGQVIVSDDVGFEIRDINHAERRFSACIPDGRVVAYDWDERGTIYCNGCKALQSENTHLADAIFTVEQVDALCREGIPEVRDWTEIERFELQGNLLQPYAGSEILPYPAIRLTPSLVEWPEKTKPCSSPA